MKQSRQRSNGIMEKIGTVYAWHNSSATYSMTDAKTKNEKSIATKAR
jgi:hypothetical protein